MDVAVNPERVQESLNTIRPYLQQDGGDVELVEITEDNDVILRLVGACSACSMSEMTMTAGIEQAIRSALPEVSNITAIKED